jgi:molybdate transport system regulatory protein
MIRVSLRFDFDNGERFGPGKADLLDAIETHGSIRAAGASMGMSYRRAWLLVDTMNRMFEAPLVETAHGGPRGGGAKLTEAGRATLALYRGMETSFARACAADLARLESQSSCARAQPPEAQD